MTGGVSELDDFSVLVFFYTWEAFFGITYVVLWWRTDAALRLRVVRARLPDRTALWSLDPTFLRGGYERQTQAPPPMWPCATFSPCKAVYQRCTFCHTITGYEDVI